MKEYLNAFRNSNNDITLWSIFMAMIALPIAIPMYIIWFIFFYKIK